MDYECVSNKYETYFKKLVARNIDRRKIAPMIYVPPNNFMFKYKPKEMVIKKTLYHLTYGHTYDIYLLQKPWVDKTFEKTNHKGPKKIWVLKNKIIHVVDILNNKVKTPVMVPGLWMLSTHGGKKAYVPMTRT